MPSSMTDFLNTFLNLRQVQNQTEQVAQAAEQQAINGMTTFMDLAKRTADPGMRQALVQRFSDLGVADSDQLSAMQSHVAPTIEAQKEIMTQYGVEQAGGHTPADRNAETSRLADATTSIALTGQNIGQRQQSSFLGDVFRKAGETPGLAGRVAQAAGIQSATGLSEGGFAESQATAGQTPEVLGQQAGIRGGTTVSPYQAGTLNLSAAQLAETARMNSIDARYKMGMLGVDAAKAMKMGDTAAEEHKVKLIEQKVNLLKALTEAKQKDPTSSAIVGFIGALNAVNAQLMGMGVPQEGFLDYNPNELLNPGGFFGNSFPAAKGPRQPGRQGPSAGTTTPILSPADATKR